MAKIKGRLLQQIQLMWGVEKSEVYEERSRGLELVVHEVAHLTLLLGGQPPPILIRGGGVTAGVKMADLVGLLIGFRFPVGRAKDKHELRTSALTARTLEVLDVPPDQSTSTWFEDCLDMTQGNLDTYSQQEHGSIIDAIYNGYYHSSRTMTIAKKLAQAFRDTGVVG